MITLYGKAEHPLWQHPHRLRHFPVTGELHQGRVRAEGNSCFHRDGSKQEFGLGFPGRSSVWHYLASEDSSVPVSWASLWLGAARASPLCVLRRAPGPLHQQKVGEDPGAGPWEPGASCACVHVSKPWMAGRQIPCLHAPCGQGQ